MRKKTIAAGAALCAAMGGGIAQPSRAQGAVAVPPASPEAAMSAEAPSLAYDTNYVTFMDRPWSRMHNAAEILAPPSLFPRFDPAEGLERRAQTSRVAQVGFRTEVFAPVIDAGAEDIVEVPITVRGGEPLVAYRVFLVYEPDILEPLDAFGVGIPTEDLGFNANPDPKEVVNADRTVAAVNVLTRPWRADGPVIRLRFRALKPGVSPLRASLSEIASDKFEIVPSVFRSGLVKVRPVAE